MQETRYICSVICKQILFHIYNELIKLYKLRNFFGNRCDMETYSSCTKVPCLMAHSPLRSLPELLGMSRLAVAAKYSTVQRDGARWLVQAMVRPME
jgi:hypothetical protein